MIIFSKIRDYIKNRITSKITESDERKMAIFSSARDRLLNLMIKKQMITKTTIRIHSVFITFFGCGKLRHGPGTLASFMTVALWFGASYLFNKFDVFTSLEEMLFWITISTILFIYGILFIPLYEKHLNSHDHQSIVIDEVVGQIVALCLTYPLVRKYYFDNTLFLNQLIMMGHIILSFTLFRFLDITKPLFIGWIDRNVKGSLGVMLDDLACGLVATIVNVAIFTVYNHSVLELHALI
ncbi:MAG: phosphatidylglycerophosphatase A [Rickettsiales bacterium]|nr:phosphatidylglycerophosphatase A [Rickettsiales bacterium]